jgi:hypothetical protein
MYVSRAKKKQQPNFVYPDRIRSQGPYSLISTSGDNTDRPRYYKKTNSFVDYEIKNINILINCISGKINII